MTIIWDLLITSQDAQALPPANVVAFGVACHSLRQKVLVEAKVVLKYTYIDPCERR
jgi:hypothetical protein